MKDRKRRGFTLVELLVVIGIISMLIALLLPALLSGQEEANQVKCRNNIKQHATAITQYAMKKKRYPGYADTREVDSGVTGRMTIDIGWGPQVFPYLDMEDRLRDFEQRCAVARGTDDAASPRRWIDHIELFVCPSDPPDFDTPTCISPSSGTPEDFVVKYPLSYAVNGGKPDVVGADSREFGIFHDYREFHDGTMITGPGPKKIGVQISDIKDGKGNTLLVTENADLVEWTSMAPLPSNSEFHQAVVISNSYDPTLTPSERQTNLSAAQEDQFPATSKIGLNYGLIAPDTCDSDATKVVQYGQLMAKGLTSVDGYRSARPSSFHQDGFNVGYADTHVDLFFVEDPKSTDAYARYCREMTPAGHD